MLTEAALASALKAYEKSPGLVSRQFRLEGAVKAGLKALESEEAAGRGDDKIWQRMVAMMAEIKRFGSSSHQPSGPTPMLQNDILLAVIGKAVLPLLRQLQPADRLHEADIWSATSDNWQQAAIDGEVPGDADSKPQGPEHKALPVGPVANGHGSPPKTAYAEGLAFKAAEPKARGTLALVPGS